MRRDFTIKVYLELLDALQQSGYAFQTYAASVKNPLQKSAVLRHDVDRSNQRSLLMARIQKERNISGSYYFRIVPQSWDPAIIKEVSNLGHEVGYHYEDVDIIRRKGNYQREEMLDEAFRHFVVHLQKLRKLAPVETICSHGSPLSPLDNKIIWTKHSYKSLGVIAEPYLDTDFSTVAYLTDAGRRWNGRAVIIRDHATGNALCYPYIRSTRQLIHAVRSGNLPDHLLLNFHPQRWYNELLPWMRELLFQGIKNLIKRILLKVRPIK
jgi:hypothetical protein